MQSHLARTTLRAAATARPAAPLAVLAPGLLPRTFTTSAAARLAQPQTGPTEPGHAPLHAAPVRKQRAQFAAQTPDYSQGPSALDKAASLFFFTEIVRGASLPPEHRRDLVLTLAPTRAGMAVVLEQVRLSPSSHPLRARVAKSPPQLGPLADSLPRLVHRLHSQFFRCVELERLGQTSASRC